MNVLLGNLHLLGPTLIKGALISLLIFYALHLLHRPLLWAISLARFCLIVCVFCAFGFPIVIAGVSFLSQNITSHRSVEVRKQLETHDISQQSDFGGDDVKDHAHWGVKRYEKHSPNLHKRHRHLTSNIIEHIVCVLLDAFIFPALLLFGVIYALRRFSQQFLERIRERKFRTLKKDLP
ncbi:MAG: hypothetical protein CMO81_08645 [Waddliaceae bacterium]|nr:hypothetical protein [Waddliaceae bacterium]